MGGRELFLAANALAVAGSTASGGGPCYEVTILQGPPDYQEQPSSTYATAINELGDVAGLYYPTIYSRGFWWDGDEVIPLEEPAAFGETVPFDINDARQIVGEFRGASAEDYRGFLYENGNWTILEPPPGGLFSGAEGINESGQVAGYRTLPDLQQNHGFLWQAGTFTDIIAPGAYVTYPQAVNEIGQVVGYMSSGLIHAFLWEGGDAIDLGVLPGGDWSHAWAINDAGQVAGNSRIPNPDGPGQVYRATLWSEGSIVDLGTLPGFSRSSANGLNDAGAVVGRCDDYPHSPGQTAFLWQGGVLTDPEERVPPELGLDFSSAADISNAGQIAASARNVIYGWVAVVLTPIARLTGDINGDCGVNVVDLLLLLSDWGAAGSPADLDGDGTVGVMDLLILLANWTSPSS